MAGSTRLVDLVQQRIDALPRGARDELSRRSHPIWACSPRPHRGLLSGGKRFRALFCYWGWQSVAAIEHDDDPDAGAAEQAALDLPAVVTVAAALEIFHAAALVHDDIMDNSDLRRGASGRPPARSSRCTASAGLGRRRRPTSAPPRPSCSAICCWAGATSCSTTAAADSPDRCRGRGRRASEFARMRTEVIVGQYLDILEEASWRAPAGQRAPVARAPRHRLQVGEVQRRVAARDRRVARRGLARPARRAARVRAAARRRLPAARRPARCLRRSGGHRQARRRRPSRGQAHRAHRPRPTEAAGLGGPPARRAARRSGPRRRADRDAAEHRSGRAAPSTRSSGSSRATSNAPATALDDAPLGRIGPRGAASLADTVTGATAES